MARALWAYQGLNAGGLSQGLDEQDACCRKESKDQTKALQWYNDAQFVKTRDYMKRTVDKAELVRGFTLLSKMRIGALLTARRLAQMRVLDARYLDMCPACKEAVPETSVHILCECRCYRGLRTQYLDELIQQGRALLEQQSSEVTSENVAKLLLGGEVGGACLKGWVPAKPRKVVLSGLNLDESDSSNDDAESVDMAVSANGKCVQVAAFLQRAWLWRTKHVSGNLVANPPRANAPSG